MKALSLFSGIGGLDLAAHWAGIETVAFCEREPFPQKVLRKHWPDVPIYDDVCTLTKERLEADGIDTRTIGAILAGYPCQPFSHAGNRKGKDDDRHLWPEARRLIKAIRPPWFVGENVAGHVSLGLDDVLADLEDLNYTAWAVVIPAAAVGAPHRRDRVVVLGHTECSGRCGESWGRAESQSEDGHLRMEIGDVADSPRELPHGDWGERRGRNEYPDSSEALADACGSGWKERDVAAFADRSRHSTRGDNARRTIRTIESRVGGVLDGLSSRLDGFRWPAGRRQQQHDWEPPRVKSGVKNRAGRLKSLGNAVVPEQFYPVFEAMMQIEAMNTK